MPWEFNGFDEPITSTDNLILDNLDERLYNVFMSFKTPTVLATLTIWIRIDNDSTAVYSSRGSFNGNADRIRVDQTEVELAPGPTQPVFGFTYMPNTSEIVQLGIHHHVRETGVGAAFAPDRRKVFFKRMSTTPYTDFRITNIAGSGEFAQLSYLQGISSD